MDVYNQVLQQRQELLIEREILMKKVLELGLPVDTKKRIDEHEKTIKELQDENAKLRLENENLRKTISEQQIEIDNLNNKVSALIKMESKLAIQELICRAKNKVDEICFNQAELGLIRDIKIKKDTNKAAHYFPPEKIREAIKYVYPNKKLIIESIFSKVFPPDEDDEESELDKLLCV
jgi:regulator of replication initiation timing